MRACNYIKFKTGQNLPPVLKIVTRPVHAALTWMMLKVCSKSQRIGLNLEKRELVEGVIGRTMLVYAEWATVFVFSRD